MQLCMCVIHRTVMSFFFSRQKNDLMNTFISKEEGQEF